MIYGDKIKHLRERNNIKQKDLIKEIKISKSLYSEYEQERKIMPLKHLNIVTNFFNVSFDYIFGITNEPSYDNSKSDINPKLIEQRLKALRKEQNITQDKLQKIIGRSNSTISDYERGKIIISTYVLYTICKKYNISADYLLGKIDVPKYIK